MRYFSQLIGHNGYRFGFPDCALDELYVPSASRLLSNAGVIVHADCKVTTLLTEGHRCNGAVLGEGNRVMARYTVACLPPAELLDILPDTWRRSGELRDLDRFRPSPYLSVYQWFDRKLTSRRFWARVWSESNLNYDFYDLSNIRADWRDRPSIIASNIIHGVDAEGRSDEDIFDTTLRELADFAPEVLNAKVIHRTVHRIPMAIPCPHPGTESLRPKTETSFDGLLLAGDWTDTGLPACMESAARSGFLAAESILAREGKPRALARLPRPTEGIAGLVNRVASLVRGGGAAGAWRSSGA